MADKLVVIDGHAIAHRAFYAMPMLTNTEGQYTNAAYGFALMLLKIIRDQSPTHMAVAFDSSAPTFRHERFAEYKAQRKAMPDELRPQIPVIKELVAAFGIPAFECEGFEADDIIGTLAAQVSQGPNPMPVTIVTGDRDVLQLVSDNVSALITKKGVTDLDVYGPDEVRAKYGLEPRQLIDVKALMGDASDNVPGVPGIGEKTAIKIIQEFGDLETAIARAEEVTPAKAREALASNVEQARESRLLVQIHQDVPVDIDVDTLRVKGFDRRSIEHFFRRMGFKSILSRLGELPAKEMPSESPVGLLSPRPSDAPPPSRPSDGRLSSGPSDGLPPEKQGTGPLEGSPEASPACGRPSPAPECPVADLEELESIALAAKGAGGAIAIDLLLSIEEPMKAELVGISLYSRQTEQACYVPTWIRESGESESRSRRESALRILRPVLEDESVPKYMHEAKKQIAFLLRHGIRLRGLRSDTAIAAYLLNPDSSSYSLSDLLFRYTEDRFVPESALYGRGSNTPQYHDIVEVPPEEVARRYSRAVCELPYLADLLEAKVKEAGMDKLGREVELPLVEVLAQMEFAGVRIDSDRLRELSKIMEKQIRELEREIYVLAGQTFNINSTKQLATVLFEDLGLPAVKKTKTGYSTDQEVLEALAPMYRICQALLEYRTLTKLKGTYVDALPELVNRRTGRIHTSFNQTVTATGRLSSTNPNLQNIPVRTEAGRMIREVFVPGEGFDCVVSADYSQIELRVLAHMSEDEALTEAFLRDEDIHAKTAGEVFSIPAEWVTPEQRNQAKAVNFGIVYGISDYGLSRSLGIPVGEAKRYIDGYFRLYKGVKRYMDRTVEEARRNGYVTTLLGRRRYLPELNSTSVPRRKFAERTAMNTPIQGSAADIIKVAMVKVDREIESRGLRSRLLLQVHDELVFEAVEDELGQLEEIVTQAMESAAGLRVPLKVDISVGRNWKEAK